MKVFGVDLSICTVQMLTTTDEPGCSDGAGVSIFLYAANADYDL